MVKKTSFEICVYVASTQSNNRNNILEKIRMDVDKYCDCPPPCTGSMGFYFIHNLVHQIYFTKFFSFFFMILCSDEWYEPEISYAVNQIFVKTELRYLLIYSNLDFNLLDLPWKWIQFISHAQTT